MKEGANAMISGSDAAKKWANRTRGASEDYKAGIQRVTEAPGAKAAAAADRWSAKLSSSATKDKFRRKVAAVDITAWKTAAAGKGADRISSGVEAGTGKMASFMDKFIPYAHSAQLPPKGTDVESGVARAAAQIRHNAGFKG